MFSPVSGFCPQKMSSGTIYFERVPGSPEKENGMAVVLSSRLLLSSPCVTSLAALSQRYYVALGSANVQLARTTNLVLRVCNHFFPLSHPAHCTRQCEDTCEHFCRDAQCFLYDT